LLNLTPHPIVLEHDGVRVTLPPSGQVARVATEETVVSADQPARAAELASLLGQPGQLVIADDEREIAIAVPVIARKFGQVTGLPTEDEACIVSSLVLEAIRAQQPWRKRVYAPDTGPTAIRDDAGRIVAVRRLIGGAP